MSAVATLNDVRKSYGATKALDGLTVTANEGDLLALLGPNGAGKTTAISVLTGFREADSGEVKVLGGSPDQLSVRRQMGVTPQETAFPNNLRVREILRLVRAHFPAPLDDNKLFARFPLESLNDRQVGGLSGGQKRTLSVALAFVGNPRLVFLDEPTTGLDVEARRALWDAIRSFRDDGGTVILTTHYLEEAEALASRVAVITGGSVIAEGTPDEIKGSVAQSRVEFSGLALPDDFPGVTRMTSDGDRITILTRDPDALVRDLVSRGIDFQGLQVRAASLEEAFLEIIKSGQGASEKGGSEKRVSGQ
jgi:ABC-2 type transport system ATP-binding protein